VAFRCADCNSLGVSTRKYQQYVICQNVCAYILAEEFGSKKVFPFSLNDAVLLILIYISYWVYSCGLISIMARSSTSTSISSR
jgi:hypothetical protein